MKAIKIALTMMVVLLVVCAAAITEAQIIGKRFAPQGTFRGDTAVLVTVGRSNPEIGRYYNSKFGAGWDVPGVLIVEGGASNIPDGALVPGNALLTKEGRVKEMSTRQRGSDTAWYVRNSRSGMGMWVKSCGQGFSTQPPTKPTPPQSLTLETDIDVYVTLSVSATATATASSRSDATAQGGNASSNAVIYMPQPTYVPQPRILATVGNDRYQVAALSWVPVTRNEIAIVNSNVNTNTLSQTQSQSQAQAQSQAQSLAVGIGM